MRPLRVFGLFPRLTHFGLGCLITAGSFAAYWYSYPAIVTLGLGDPAVASWPEWLKLIREAIAYLPWIAMAGAVLARLLLGRRVRLFSFAGGLATPFIASMLLFYLGPIVADHWHRQPFDAAAWRATGTETSREWKRYPTRLTMADDLVASGILKNKTRSEIAALLGPPTETSGFRGVDMVYYLGPERGLIAIDSEWLLITLGSDGKAEKVVIGFD